MTWENLETEQNHSGDVEMLKKSKKNPFKPRPHYVMLVVFIVGILAIVAVCIWIGIDKNRTDDAKSGSKQVSDAGVCGSNPCKHGTCRIVGENTECTCGRGYTGINCEQVKAQTCPDVDPTLIPWSPGDQPTLDVTISGVGYLLNASANVNTILISNGGRLVVQDYGEGTPTITLRTRQILIVSNSELIVGAESCPYLGNLDIVLWGRLDDGGPSDPGFGRKFIGAAPTGSMTFHGKPKLSWTRITATLAAGAAPGTILDLVDDASTWETGDEIVIASSDFDPAHAEVFTLADCTTCTATQIQINESPTYTHFGEVVSGADMRAEVGLLSRNVKIRGEVEAACYGSPLCAYLPDDVFGGQTQFLVDFTTAQFSDVEFVDMGQQTLGAYPVHFHRVGDVAGSYVRRLSIHRSRSRCVTIHGAQSLVVEDVVGYDAYGHCFFLEDGFEFNNTLRHNLGILTKAGSLLPSDRDEAMCTGLLDNVYPGYTPNAGEECRSTSTFWITHPDNTIEDNVAAGSDEYGFFYAFHREPTSGSVGELPPYHSEHSPLASFRGNTAHSNERFGFRIDRGVKIDAADATDPREQLAMVNYARFSPHENRDLSQPRVPAVFDSLTAYKNRVAADFRGGDIVLQNSYFMDNIIGVRMHSEHTLPYDIGSHQEIRSSHFDGESPNLRDDVYPAMPTQKGIELMEGPVVVSDCTMRGFIADGTTKNVSVAIGFSPNHEGQNSIRTSIDTVNFRDQSLRIHMGDSQNSADGEQTVVVMDTDGSVSGTVGATLVRADREIINPDAQCTTDSTQNVAVCTGYSYGQVFMEASTTTLTMSVYSKTNPAALPYILTGTTNDDDMTYTSKNYQPLVVDGEGYSVNWDGVAPANITISPHNFIINGFTQLDLCYPTDTTFTVNYQEWDQLTDVVLVETPLTPGTSLGDVVNDPLGMVYFWDNVNRLLHMKIVQRYTLSGYNYCSDQGCERYHVQATITNQDVSDCSAPLIQ